MLVRIFLACALMAPAGAMAQVAAAPGPVTVEIVAAGEVTAPAQRFRASVTLTAKGDTEAAASAKLAADKAKLIQALAGQGIRVAQPGPGGANSLMGLVAGMGGLSKPTISLDSFGEDPEAKPQATAKETVQFDAPSRAAAASMRKTVESTGATMDEAVIGLLDDYPAAARRAKANALVKARAEAAAYGETLGLPQAAIVRISEKSDFVQGSLGFVTELLGMFAPKSEQNSNDVTVSKTLTVEFRLSK